MVEYWKETTNLNYNSTYSPGNYLSGYIQTNTQPVNG